MLIVTKTEQDNPQAADGQEDEEPVLPTSGEGSASIVARLQIQRELATKPKQTATDLQRSQGWREE